MEAYNEDDPLANIVRMYKRVEDKYKDEEEADLTERRSLKERRDKRRETKEQVKKT